MAAKDLLDHPISPSMPKTLEINIFLLNSIFYISHALPISSFLEIGFKYPLRMKIILTNTA
jgi:hypothetical protein